MNYEVIISDVELEVQGFYEEGEEETFGHPSWPSYFEATKVSIAGTDVTQLFIDYIGFDEIEQQVMEKYYS